MDELVDRLQSGLFFHQLNAAAPEAHAIEPRALVPRPPNHVPTPVSMSGSTIATPPSPFLPDPSSLPPPKPTALPLLSVAVDVDVNGRLCTTKVTQKFSNASSSVAPNAKYVFPVYDGSVVTSFRCWIGTKLLEGAVKAKETAQAEFKEAVSQYKAAVLVEEQTPEVFETNVGNIPAETTVQVEISYTNLLKVDNSTGGLVLTIPTSIAPRYGTAPPGYTPNQSLQTDGLKISVNASMPAAIRKMESRSHPISVEIGAVSHSSFEQFAAGAAGDSFDPTKGRATLSDRTAVLHKDFVLFILSGSRELAKSRAVAASQPGTGDLSTVAVTIRPGDLFVQNVNMEDFEGEIIFMVDRSGSMRSKIPSLINVLNIFLRSLPQKCSFNIASFGSRVSWMWPNSQKYSQQNLELASDQVGSFESNFGGTEIYGALESVRSHHNTSKDVATNVILLTDGEVWNVDNVIQLVRDMSSDQELNVRFFSIGIGDRVSHRLVEGIGEQGGGYAEVVPESSTGSWQERVIQMLKAALTPSRLRCEVDFGEKFAANISAKEISGHTIKRPAYLQAPYSIPALTAFSHFSVYYMMESPLAELPATVTVTATTDKGEKLTTQLPLDKLTEETSVHHLAAKALMNDYETGRSWLHECNPGLRSDSPDVLEQILKEEAQVLGQKWSITSKWTSYVAVDSSTSQHHEASICKADAVQIRNLMKSRPMSMGCFGSFAVPGRSSLSKEERKWLAEAARSQSSASFASFGHIQRNSLAPDRSMPLTLPPPPPPPQPSLQQPLSYGVEDFDYAFAGPSGASPDSSSSGYDKLYLASPKKRGKPRSSRVSAQSADQSHKARSASGLLPPPPPETVPELAGPLTSATYIPAGTPESAPPPSRRAMRSVSGETMARLNRSIPVQPLGTVDIERSPESVESASSAPQVESHQLTGESWPMNEAPIQFGYPQGRPTLSLDNLLRAQAADGEFRTHGPRLEESLIPDGKADFLGQFLDSVFKNMPVTPEQDVDVERESVRFNILAILYITDVHATSRGLWELQVSKAWQWLRRKVADLWARKGCSGDLPDMSLEKLESSVIIGQLVSCAGAFDSARPGDVS